MDDIWIKDEHVLCAFTYDKNSKVLSVYPDFSTTVAYTIRTVGEEIRKFSYFIENGSANIPDSDIQKEQEILRIVSKILYCNFKIYEIFSKFLFFRSMTIREILGIVSLVINSMFPRKTNFTSTYFSK